MTENTQRNAVIIGAGPAGYTAALYLSRGGYNPIIYTGSLEPGGALTTTTLIENYPGFPEGIQGPDLMEAFRKQAERFGAEVDSHDVAAISTTPDSDGYMSITLDDGTVVPTRTILVCTGSKYRTLGAPGEKEYRGHGVSYCATCDGFFFRGKSVVVLGGGDSAMTDAIFLTKFSDNVTLIHRREEFRASKIMVEKAKATGKIHFILNTIVTKIEGDGHEVTSLETKNVVTGKVEQIPTSGIFITIGSVPSTAFLKGQLALDPKGYIQVSGSSTKTSVPGVFAAGDVADPVYRQAVSAAGTGCRAALDAQHFLEEKDR